MWHWEPAPDWVHAVEVVVPPAEKISTVLLLVSTYMISSDRGEQELLSQHD